MKKWFWVLAFGCVLGALLVLLFNPSGTRQPAGERPAPPPAQPASPNKLSIPAASIPIPSGVPAVPAAQPPGPTPQSATATPAPTLAPIIANLPATPPLAPEAADLPPATMLDNMRIAIRLFGSMFGGNPVGTNPEITSALNGNNPKQAQFIRPEAGMRINDKGELIDPWGTPYFFHQLSAKEMEIHSAGPDRKMWTDDDLVTR